MTKLRSLKYRGWRITLYQGGIDVTWYYAECKHGKRRLATSNYGAESIVIAEAKSLIDASK